METTPGEEAESATLLPEEGSKKPSSASSMAETIIAVEKVHICALIQLLSLIQISAGASKIIDER